MGGLSETWICAVRVQILPPRAQPASQALRLDSHSSEFCSISSSPAGTAESGLPSARARVEKDLWCSAVANLFSLHTQDATVPTPDSDAGRRGSARTGRSTRGGSTMCAPDPC